MAVFTEPAKWAGAMGAGADSVTIPDTAGDTEPDIDKLFPSVFSIPLAQGGRAIPRTVLNGLFKTIGEWVYYAQQGGIASYSADIDYAAGRLVSSGNVFYVCVQANGPSSSVIAPGSDTDYWQLLPNIGDVTSLITSTINNLSIFDLCPDGAAQHNALYRGKDITSLFDSGEFSTNVANGTFKDIFPGDYIDKPITISGTTYDAKWIIGDLDHMFNYGDTALEEHHCAIFPDLALGTSYMNSTNITTDAYKGSYMYLTKLPPVRTAISNLFGASHLCNFRLYLTKTINTSYASMAGTGWTGASSANEWTDCTVELMSENQVYGSKFSSSRCDRYDTPHIMAAFQHNPTLRFNDLENNRYVWWLRDVVSSAHFAVADYNGSASGNSASGVHGVRPFCLIK